MLLKFNLSLYLCLGHRVAMHSSGLSKAASKQSRRVDVDFAYSRFVICI